MDDFWCHSVCQIFRETVPEIETSTLFRLRPEGSVASPLDERSDCAGPMSQRIVVSGGTAVMDG